MTNEEIARFEQETGWKYEDAVQEMFERRRELRLFGTHHDGRPHAAVVLSGVDFDGEDDRGDETWDFEVPYTEDGRIDKRRLRELRLFGNEGYIH